MINNNMHKICFNVIDEKPIGYIKNLKRFINISDDLFNKIEGYNHIDFSAKTFIDAKDQMDKITNDIGKNTILFSSYATTPYINKECLPKRYQDKENFLKLIHRYFICRNMTTSNNYTDYRSIQLEFTPEIYKGNIIGVIRIIIYFNVAKKDNLDLAPAIKSIRNSAELNKVLGINEFDFYDICKKYNLVIERFLVNN